MLNVDFVTSTSRPSQIAMSALLIGGFDVDHFHVASWAAVASATFGAVGVDARAGAFSIATATPLGVPTATSADPVHTSCAPRWTSPFGSASRAQRSVVASHANNCGPQLAVMQRDAAA